MNRESPARPAASGVGALACSLVSLLERVPLSIIQLLLRVGISSVFFKSGLVKIQSWDSTVMLFQYEYDVPVLGPDTAATLSAIFELGMPVLIGLGLLARLATLPLIGMTVVIEIFVYPLNWAEHLIWFSILLLVLTRGPGAISLDHLLGPWLARRLGLAG